MKWDLCSRRSGEIIGRIRFFTSQRHVCVFELSNLIGSNVFNVRKQPKIMWVVFPFTIRSKSKSIFGLLILRRCPYFFPTPSWNKFGGHLAMKASNDLEIIYLFEIVGEEGNKLFSAALNLNMPVFTIYNCGIVMDGRSKANHWQNTNCILRGNAN